MNSLLLRFPSSGNANVVASVGSGQSRARQDLLPEDEFQIGSVGLHCDFADLSADGSVQQTSFHIWSYIATTASTGSLHISVMSIMNCIKEVHRPARNHGLITSHQRLEEILEPNCIQAGSALLHLAQHLGQPSRMTIGRFTRGCGGGV